METTTDGLRELHEDYAQKVNAAVEEDRWDLVDELSDSFLDESMALMTGATETA